MKVEKFSDGNIVKYVFIKEDACYEAVLYKYPTYEERTVLCISTQCGCPVGCQFCGTGKQFIRNLTDQEIIDQVAYIFSDIGYITRIEKPHAIIQNFVIKKCQIMLMSMGEPFLNYSNVSKALKTLNHWMRCNADLLVSTIGPHANDDFYEFLGLSMGIQKIGLQFSVHKSTDEARNILIPFKQKMSLFQIRNYGVQWWNSTGRKPYVNYCIDGTNNTIDDYNRLIALFPPNVFCFTFSVICAADQTMKDAGFKNINAIEEFQQKFIKVGYDTRVFNPDGQDSVGGGCGQLWYVQDWMQQKKLNKN